MDYLGEMGRDGEFLTSDQVAKRRLKRGQCPVSFDAPEREVGYLLLPRAVRSTDDPSAILLGKSALTLSISHPDSSVAPNNPHYID